MISRLKNYFTDHPQSVGESYFEHMQQALFFSFRMLLGGLACLSHGFLPFLFKSTGSGTISLLNDRMVINRRVKVEGATYPSPGE